MFDPNKKIISVFSEEEKKLMMEVESSLDRKLGEVNHVFRLPKPESYPRRFFVPDEKIKWSEDFSEYKPRYFVHQNVLKNDQTINPRGWANPEDISKVTKEIKSFEPRILFDKDGHPLNPRGRTGLKGRGLLGKWGPNFAVDIVLTRKNIETKKIEMLIIKRSDNFLQATPGGMIDMGESALEARQRELTEETGAEIDLSDMTEL